MPYEWRDQSDGAELLLWPHRSLPRKGFAWFIGATVLLLGLPLLAVLGSAVLWGILPFMVLAVGGTWFAISRSYRSGETRERLEMNRARILLIRHDPGRRDREWAANPYWIHAAIRPGPVERYLVLTGDHESGRTVELGAFLTPEEREALQIEVNTRLARLR